MKIVMAVLLCLVLSGCALFGYPGATPEVVDRGFLITNVELGIDAVVAVIKWEVRQPIVGGGYRVTFCGRVTIPFGEYQTMDGPGLTKYLLEQVIENGVQPCAR
jgi:hypothetical protein